MMLGKKFPKILPTGVLMVIYNGIKLKSHLNTNPRLVVEMVAKLQEI